MTGYQSMPRLPLGVGMPPVVAEQLEPPPAVVGPLGERACEPSKICSSSAAYAFHGPPSTRYSVVARPLPPSSVAFSVTVTGPLA